MVLLAFGSIQFISYFVKLPLHTDKYTTQVIHDKENLC